MKPVLQAVKASRLLHSSARVYAASIFRMPAMSPTMTEGGIVDWKVKDGQSFSAGDVLLEVETDKATIDVEAQDDGVMWQILKANGESGISVGSPIAYMAEPEDDLSTLEKPKDEQDSGAASKATTESKAAPESEAVVPETKVESKSQGEQQESSHNASHGAEIFVKADPKQNFLPSVEILLHKNQITREEAINKIQASGPKGRLLKGDILAFLGKIKPESISNITEWIHSREHLDLSNIVIAESQGPSKAEAAAEAAAAAEASAIEAPSNIIDIELSRQFKLNDEFESIEEVQEYFQDGLAMAETDSYGSKYPQYRFSPSAAPNKTDLFEDLIRPAATEKRFEVVDVKYEFITASKAPVAMVDNGNDLLFDEIIGVAPLKKVEVEQGADGEAIVNVSIKVKYNDKLVDSMDFVKSFEQELQRL